MFVVTFSLGSSFSANAANKIHCKDHLLDIIEDERFKDSTFYNPIVISAEDQVRIVKSFNIPLRSEFNLLVLKVKDPHSSLVALVPKKSDGSKDYVGQQVVQWQKVNISPDLITGLQDLSNDGPLTLELIMKNVLYSPSEFKTEITIAKPVPIERVSLDDLVDYIKKNPKIHIAEEKPTPFKNILRALFGKIWINIIGKNGEYNALSDSEKLLSTQKVITPGKVKNLHVVGEIFKAELIINQDSPFSGFLAPGKYYLLGRLSSGMKNLQMRNSKNGEPELNSLAIGALLFRTNNEKEEPGLLLLQDSLVPVNNPGLSEYQLSNNPGFAFKPTSIREFLEQGATIAGVAIASFLNKIDSARGLQANFRSNQSAASHHVHLNKGEIVHAPRYLSIQLHADRNRMKNHHVDSVRADSKAYFQISYSDDGHYNWNWDWKSLGRIENIEWLGIDSHELTFPHGLSGAIHPNTLIPSSSVAGIKGLQLPTQVTPLQVKD